MLAEQLLLAGIGLLGTVVGLFGLRVTFFGSYEELEPPLGWGGDLGIGRFETARSRRLLWLVYGVVSLATGLVFFWVLATTL